MVGSLEFPSQYFDRIKFRDLQTHVGGVGLELTKEDDQIRVVAPIEEAPAAKAGVMANDIITHVDEQPMRGLSLIQVIEKTGGPLKTKVTLRIKRSGQDRPFDVSIMRELVQQPVRSRLEGDDDVGYIRITRFDDRTTELLKTQIGDLTAKSGGKLKGFIIDLRNNPGGLLDQAISVSDAFLEKGEIVTTRGRNAEKTKRFNALAGDLSRGKPIAILINGGSAAGAEIVAGALQDHKRATLIGTRTFGRGSVQTITPMGWGNGALSLTTSLIFTPSGRSIQASGISPNIEVKQDGEAASSDQLQSRDDSVPGGGLKFSIPADPKDDKVLRMAVDRLRRSRPGRPN
jgi:carboxyl-terminal processing protease